MPTEIYVDGASAGNPGPSGIGIFIKHEGTAESFSFQSECIQIKKRNFLH